MDIIDFILHIFDFIMLILAADLGPLSISSPLGTTAPLLPFALTRAALAIIMMTRRSIVLLIFFSAPSISHAFGSSQPSKQQLVLQSTASSINNIIIDGDSPVVIVPQTPRRSFLFSAAAAVTGCTVSWQCNPLIAKAAATDCFADCLKNCKLIAPKVRS